MIKKISLAALVIVFLGSIYFTYQDSKNVQENQEKLSSIITDRSAVVVANATCGCCKLYAQYLKQQGFDVQMKEVTQDELTADQDALGIPQNMRSCHTTKIGKYFIEGHVPMEAITKLFTEKPDIKGITLPAMPSASPGMPGPKVAPFVIDSITDDNKDGGVFLTI